MSRFYGLYMSIKTFRFNHKWALQCSRDKRGALCLWLFSSYSKLFLVCKYVQILREKNLFVTIKFTLGGTCVFNMSKKKKYTANIFTSKITFCHCAPIFNLLPLLCICTSCGAALSGCVKSGADVVLGPPHVLWEVSFRFWVTWSISSWQEN